MNTQLFLVFVLVAAMTACTVGPDYETPSVEEVGWIDGKESPQAEPDWWRVFEDPMLTELVNKAAAGNLDIKVAELRITQARAIGRLDKARLLPFFSADGAATRIQQSINDPQFIQAPGLNIPRTQERFDVGFDAGWELDFFGRNRRAIEASQARVGASVAQKRNTVVSVIAETVRNYIALRSAQRRAESNKRNAVIQQQTVDLIRASLDVGFARELDLIRAQAQLASTRSLLPSIEADIRSATLRLAVLCGDQPDALLERLEQKAILPIPAGIVPRGLKSDLLRRRPDIQAAERELAAATADVGVAVASLYPSFNITAGAGLLAGQFDNLIESNSETTLVSPVIKLPIFEGGRLRAQIKDAKARNSIAAINYEQIILKAFEEVENVLVRYSNAQKARAELIEAADAYRQSAELSAALYENGLIRFIDVLTAERDVLIAEDSLIQSEELAMTNLVAVYKALGGGWEVFETHSAKQRRTE